MRYSCDECGFTEDVERKAVTNLKGRNPTQFHGGAQPLPGVKLRVRPESKEEKLRKEYKE